jgi:hypothetical protein
VKQFFFGEVQIIMKENILKISIGGYRYVVVTLLFILCCIGATRATEGDTVIAQSATLEGIQTTSQTGKMPAENNVSYFFVFKDKPSSYFYEFDMKNKKLIFEFNDAQLADSVSQNPVQNAPVTGIVVTQKKVDVNSQVKGLTPEWHGLVTITLSLTKIPHINVKDDKNIISLNYLWTSDTAQEKNYESQNTTGKKKYLLWGAIGGVGVAGIAAGIIAGSGKSQSSQLSTSDLPVR